MTIFIENLKALISEHLMNRFFGLKMQTYVPFLYKAELSAKQYPLIKSLESSIMSFNSTNDDQKDKDAIIALIQGAIEEIEKARTSHQETNDKSRTLKCLKMLQDCTNKFYTKLMEIHQQDPSSPANKLTLLNLTDKKSINGIVYRHGCYYLGHVIFHPKQHEDFVVMAKVEALVTHMRLIHKAVLPADSFEEQQDHAEGLLRALENANNKVVGQSASTFGIPIPLPIAINFFSATLSQPKASSGLLGTTITAIREEIEQLVLNRQLDDKKQPA